VWAPRCPGCARSAGEAVEVSASRTGEEGGGSTEWPVVDAGEPEWVKEADGTAGGRVPRLRRRRTAIAVGALAVSAAVAAVAASLVSGRPAPGSPVAGLGGRIVAQSAGGQLLTVDPDGRAVRPYPALADTWGWWARPLMGDCWSAKMAS
jgi:hypothetical protein